VKAFLYFWQENVTDKIHNQKTLLIAYNLCRTLLHCLANWGNSRNTKDAFFTQMLSQCITDASVHVFWDTVWMAVLCGMLTIQYSARSAPLSVRYVCHFHL